MKRTVLCAAVAVGLVTLACGGAAPTAVDQPAPVAVSQDDGTVAASAGGKIPISGKIDFVSMGEPGRVLLTAGNIAHVFELPVQTVFTGSVEGAVTFTESWTDLKSGKTTAHGPIEGEVTWAGHSGTISGMWHTVCDPGCGGTFEAQGSGGLRGVRFHFEWGSEYFPFDYTGFAIDNSQ